MPAAARELILKHELQHMASRDACLLVMGLLTVAVAPWNVFLWWQLRRLRLAIEVDCDARVLESKADVRGYGEILLLVAQRTVASNGAFALTEATSQLHRRIEIMTRRRARGRWTALAACIGVSFGFIAAAVELNAPTVSRATVLRKLPPEYHGPYLQAAEAAARASYPEMFAGKFSGSVEIRVGLDRNGAVLGVDERSGPILSAKFFGRLPWGTRPFSNPVGWAAAHGYEAQDTVPGPTKLLAWSGAENTNRLYLSFDVIKWPYDPTRSAELVRDAVAARYPGLLRAHERVDGVMPPPQGFAGLSAAPVADTRQGHYALQSIMLAARDPLMQRGRMIKLLTVFMNDNGTINRSDLREIPARGDEPSRSPAVFAQMGLDTKELAHRGFILQGRSRADKEDVVVDYSWPRRAGDPPEDTDSLLPERVYGSPQSVAGLTRDDETLDRAIVARYFPDAWQSGTSRETAPQLWVLLDRRGNIQATGRVHRAEDAVRLPSDLALFYPGIRTGEWIRSPVNTSAGQTAWITYVWLAADSPVSDLSSFDAAKRPNVLIDVRVSQDNGSIEGTRIAATLGEPAVRDVLCFFRLEVTASDGKRDAVSLRTRIQPMAATPVSLRDCQRNSPVTSGWSPASSVLRVPYDHFGSVDLEDNNHVRWHISLSPHRL
jgi:hypothetical protein